MQRRFGDAGDVHHLPIADSIALDDAAQFTLDSAKLEPPSDGRLRLVITRSNQRVILDGRDVPVPQQPFNLLLLLKKQVANGGGFVSTIDIEKENSRRSASDLIRELRNCLSADSIDPQIGKTLIKNRRNPSGYALTLSTEEIELRD